MTFLTKSIPVSVLNYPHSFELFFFNTYLQTNSLSKTFIILQTHFRLLLNVEYSFIASYGTSYLSNELFPRKKCAVALLVFLLGQSQVQLEYLRTYID